MTMHKVSSFDAALECVLHKRFRLVFISSDHVTDLGQPEVAQINVNKSLSELLINVPRSERARSVEGMVRNLIDDAPSAVVQLNGLEILFDRSLAIDPVRLISACAKKKTILLRWPGEITNTGLIYAVPSHPEYRSYRVSDLSEVILLETDGVH